ncbi:MAG: DUF3667 domain-containing protein [Gammaproteobacteria bacterium]|nr:DUF3667 domain-containing protein [Gammaproteobacteria bacterium]
MKTNNKQNNVSNLSSKYFLNNLMSEMFGIEGRLPKTIQTLLFHPGRLTKYYIDNNYSNYIAPTTLYFTINLIFFLLLPFINTENSKFLSFSYSGFTMTEGFYKDQILSDLLKSSLQIEEYRAMFDTHISFNQPALIFIIIPFFALLLKVMEIGRERYYVEHIIFSFHFMSFFLIVFSLIASLSSFVVWLILAFDINLPIVLIIEYFLYLFIGLFLVYLFLAIRTYYNHKITTTIWKTILLFFGFIGIFFGYISFLFFHTIYMVG